MSDKDTALDGLRDFTAFRDEQRRDLHRAQAKPGNSELVDTTIARAIADTEQEGTAAANLQIKVAQKLGATEAEIHAATTPPPSPETNKKS